MEILPASMVKFIWSGREPGNQVGVSLCKKCNKESFMDIYGSRNYIVELQKFKILLIKQPHILLEQSHLL